MGIVFIRGCLFERDNLPETEEFYLLEDELLSATFREKLKESIEKEVRREVEDAFDGLQDRGAEMVFRQARDQIQCKKSLNKVGTFTRLTQNQDGANSSVRIIDSSL